MTQEEKAKRYDGNYKAYIELINRLEDVKDAIKKQNYGIAMDVLCKPYPEFQVTTHSELKDEDERIRKELLQIANESEDSIYMVMTPDKRKRLIAWLERQGNLMKALQISNAKIGELIEKNYYLREQLEKQGEQNHTNKIEPKFRVGDTIKCKYDNRQFTIKSVDLDKGIYTYTQEGCGNDIDYADEDFELVEQKPTVEMITPEESLGIDSETYSKIVDECVYGEQKPIKEHNACEFCADRYGCVNPCSMKLIEEEKPTDLPKGEDYGIDGLYAAIDILQKTLGEVDGYQSDDGILTHKCAISAVKELSKQKPAWGEEDIELLDNTIKFIEDRVAATSPSLRTYSPTLTGKEIPFLKSLKDRVQSQPKQEWSDYDECMLTNLIDDPNCSIDSEYVHWLKSLKERYSWRPSEEQVKAIKWIMDGDSPENWTVTLANLYNDLKKLREE